METSCRQCVGWISTTHMETSCRQCVGWRIYYTDIRTNSGTYGRDISILGVDNVWDGGSTTQTKEQTVAHMVETYRYLV